MCVNHSVHGRAGRGVGSTSSASKTTGSNTKIAQRHQPTWDHPPAPTKGIPTYNVRSLPYGCSCSARLKVSNTCARKSKRVRLHSNRVQNIGATGESAPLQVLPRGARFFLDGHALGNNCCRSAALAARCDLLALQHGAHATPERRSAHQLHGDVRKARRTLQERPC